MDRLFKNRLVSVLLCSLLFTAVTPVDRPDMPDVDSDRPSLAKMAAFWGMTAMFVGTVAYYGRQIFKRAKAEYEQDCRDYKNYQEFQKQQYQDYESYEKFRKGYLRDRIHEMCGIYGQACKDANALKTLGLSSSASQEDLKEAYKELALKWHPDKNKGTDTTEQFKKLQADFEYLSKNGLLSPSDIQKKDKKVERKSRAQNSDTQVQNPNDMD